MAASNDDSFPCLALMAASTTTVFPPVSSFAETLALMAASNDDGFPSSVLFAETLALMAASNDDSFSLSVLFAETLAFNDDSFPSSVLLFAEIFPLRSASNDDDFPPVFYSRRLWLWGHSQRRKFPLCGFEVSFQRRMLGFKVSLLGRGRTSRRAHTHKGAHIRTHIFRTHILGLHIWGAHVQAQTPRARTLSLFSTHSFSSS